MTIFSSVYFAGSNLPPVSAQTSSGPTFTYETTNTHEYIDPQVAYYTVDYGIMQNVYEPLLWYNGTCSTCVIPWLAQSYTASSDLKTYTFTLMSGIKFADGENLDSTAVYFSLNRALILDGSSPTGHGIQASWFLQQLLNYNESSYLDSAQPPTYNSAYVDSVLAENFVQITSPTTFTINVIHPNTAFPYLLTTPVSEPVAPNYVMQQDLALWNQTSTGYKLPYPSLSSAPDEMTMIKDYFLDEVATCNAGITPSGCATTYLDNSYEGSLAGTGPYTIQSLSKTTNDVVFQANPNYWGGAYATKMMPQYQTAVQNYVPDQATREIDLRNAASSGQAMTIDATSDHLYDYADRSMWVNNNQLVSSTPGVTLYGPYTGLSTLFDPFDMNVTNMFTGKPYTFQPFADRRLRLAFADAVNMTDINTSVNNKMGAVAINVMAPGMPPAGSFNPSITPAYSYNLDAVQSLMLDAMMHPLTSFTLENGNPAPAGTYNNTFGCSTLSASGTCAHPVTQSITLVAATGDTVDIDILNTIASNVNNVSSTYNMGLTVSVEPLPSGTMLTEAFSGNLYMYALGWYDDYPWALDFLGPMYIPGGTYPAPDGWNIPAMGTLYEDSVNASATGDNARIVSDSNAMNTLANQAVMYLWTQNPYVFFPYTSNVNGYFYNTAWSVDGPYFVSLAPATTTAVTFNPFQTVVSTMTATSATSAAAAPSSTLTTAAAAVVIIIIVAIAAIVLRSRSKKTTKT